MSINNRTNARGTIIAPSKDASFFLHAKTGVYAVSSAQDLSLTGVGIETRYRPALGEEVVLKYRHNEMQVSVTGTVRWCEQQSDRTYAIGIAFLPEDKTRNSLFFLALRKYLKEFSPVGSTVP
ncbi:MAG: PilZ domain-containing protein [Chromatiales bacterium]|nr:PilZ domain-containing protein [Chromatiales bacterium]